MIAANLSVYLLLLITSGLSTKRVNHQRMSNFYEDLGCLALPGEQAYDCSKVFEAETLGKCMYRGELFSDGEFLPEDKQRSRCQFGCLCSAPETDKPGTLICPVADCAPLWLLESENPGCRAGFTSLTDCCPSVVCEKGNMNTTCSYEGESYQLGDFIYPESNVCMNCLCNENFGTTGDGNLKTLSEGGSCEKISCDVRAESFVKGCAPVFGAKSCCAWEEYCPTGDEPQLNVTEEKTCQFGNRQFATGDEIETKDIKCSCLLPPLFTCEKKTS